MKTNYEQPVMEIIYYDNQINMLNNSIVIDYPWGSDENGYFENE